MMDKKDIISKLAGYKLEGDIEGCEKTIELGYEIMIRLEMSRHSYFELFLSTFRFIHVHTWIIQLFIFLSGITMALNFKNLQPISEIMLCITGVIFISALFFLDELFKSFTTGMWELEQTFKYDLRQHIMMKLLIFGIIDRKYGEDGVVLRLISREKPFANAKQVDPVLEDLYLFYFREGE